MTGAAADGDADRPSEAFGALAGETRLAVVRELAEGEPLSFSELFAATDEDTSAGFAYHLRQLTGRFVRKTDETYELTDAGRAVARALAAGTFTESVDRDRVAIEDPCPFCGADALGASVSDNVARVACEACAGHVLSLPLPPGGLADRDDGELAAVLDRYHRRRLGSFADGVCPECAGSVDRTVELADDGHARASFECVACGAALRCPVALSVLDHPDVVAFFATHGEDVGDRPLWNVGPEWRERVLSTDPVCVRVAVRLGGEELALFVARDATVRATRRLDAAAGVARDASDVEGTADADDDGDGDSDAGETDASGRAGAEGATA